MKFLCKIGWHRWVRREKTEEAKRNSHTRYCKGCRRVQAHYLEWEDV